MGPLYTATWGRLTASLYDTFLRGTVRAGLADRRRRLLSEAAGRTLELGSGTGLNLVHYPEAVEELVLTEPDPHMARRLRARAASLPRAPQVVEAPAERLPFEDDSFDTAVFTLVLCTVADPAAALAEVARVLRPDGEVLFLEHVRSPDPALARWQDRLHRPWRLFAAGCNCNRDTLATIEGSPLAVTWVEPGRLPKAMPIIRPMIAGSARAGVASRAAT